MAFAGLAAALMIASPASAGTSGAHFFNVGSSVNDAGSLLVGYDEAGVGNATVNYTIDVTDATAVYACINGGNNHPKAANKETVSSSLTVSFSRDPVNGRVRGTTSPPIGPTDKGDFACPSGQTLVLASVSYSGITLTDTTNNVSTAVPDASRTFVDLR
ncbi:MAG TPA: hypothetical protein VFR35_15780 [Actinoplanes sp.]|nr:hypothetical protein [Actinoplanes sp.]